MSYIGVQPTAGQYRKLDNISSGFNGSTTSFTTSVSGTNVTAGTAQQLLVSLGGVIQQPDTDYTVSTNTITFTTAPTSGLTFFAVLMGDALNTVTTSDGAITTAKLAGSLSVGLAAGTAAAPSLYFTGDTNTGIYSLGADQVAISTGGTGRLFVDSSGRVGIGTSTARAGLTVALGSASIPAAGASTGSAVFSNATDGGVYGVVVGANTSGLGYIQSQRTDGTATTYDLAIQPNGGRVGIGTTDIPADTNLAVLGNYQTGFYRNVTSGNRGYFVNIGAKTSTGFADGGYVFGAVDSGDSTGYLTFGTRTSGSVTEKARIDSSGRLLVGTSTAPSTGNGQYGRLVVQGYIGNSSAGAYINLQRGQPATTPLTSGDEIARINFSDSVGNDFAYIGCYADATTGTGDYPGRLTFSTTADGASSPTERMRITKDGRTSITSAENTWRALTVTNSANVSGNGGIHSDLGSNTNNTSSYHFIGSTGGPDRVYIYGNGNIVNQNNSYGSLSDSKLKENIVDAGSQWSDIKALQVRKYNFKEGQTHTQIGLVAQEVELVSPGLVTESPDRDEDGNDLGTTTKSVNYSVLYMKAVKALQEAMERIEQLEAKVAALESA